MTFNTVAAEVLGKFSPRVDGSFAPQIANLLQNTDVDARTVAADVLGKFGPEVDGSFAPQLAKQLQDTAMAFAKWQLRPLEVLAQSWRQLCAESSQAAS